MLGADLRGVQMQGADLCFVKIQRARLSQALLQGADFSFAQMQDVNLSNAQLQGAALSLSDMQGTKLTSAKMQGAVLSGTKMKAVNLLHAQMQGAKLHKVVFDAQTKISFADFTGASIRGADVSKTPEIADHLDQIFSDGSKDEDDRTRLPDGVDPPAHWPREHLHFNKYETAWRDWQKNTLRMAPDGSDIP
jgi:uncharacterized protein YjbI with pentapeptide repeats